MHHTRKYYVYIMVNKHKTVLYTGITNNLRDRIQQHFEGKVRGFTRKYNCKFLVFYEVFEDVHQAVSREKTIKGFRREKKEALINKMNTEWKFLNRMIEMSDDKYL